jgi:hypothetical protein
MANGKQQITNSIICRIWLVQLTSRHSQLLFACSQATLDCDWSLRHHHCHHQTLSPWTSNFISLAGVFLSPSISCSPRSFFHLLLLLCQHTTTASLSTNPQAFNPRNLLSYPAFLKGESISVWHNITPTLAVIGPKPRLVPFQIPTNTNYKSPPMPSASSAHSCPLQLTHSFRPCSIHSDHNFYNPNTHFHHRVIIHNVRRKRADAHP